ncbi:hypothetical protein [Dokdonia sp.]|uniref:hypothetical protein n=1 Tax=Dokdonia sp. TaxID=2024995 RepID=UPI003265CA27
MEEYLTVDKEYLKIYNQGYELAKETGLKSDILEKLNAQALDRLQVNKSRLSVIKAGMKQYQKDQELEKAQKLQKEQQRDNRSKGRGR